MVAPSTQPAGVLLVAATELELGGRPGLVCGVGPVEAAASTARELALNRPHAVLHIGVAGGRALTPGSLIVGTEAVYADLSAEIPTVLRAAPDPSLVAAVQAVLPEAVSLPIATTAGVSSPAGAARHDLRVEGMEGFAVLRACELAGVPAVEVRAVSNDIGEGDRGLWTIRLGLEALEAVLPRLLAALAE